MESWLDEDEAAMTICDLHGIILINLQPYVLVSGILRPKSRWHP